MSPTLNSTLNPSAANKITLSTRHLIAIKDSTVQDLELILQTADQFLEVLYRPVRKVPSLRDLTIANLFFENSTRTRLSFELAEKRLSADLINFSGSGSSISKGETLSDTVRNILAMKIDILVVRHAHAGTCQFLADRVDARIVNAGDGAHEHPTQALLDAFSIRQKFGHIQGVKVLLVGDILHSRVAMSNIFGLRKLGAEVMVTGPATLMPPHLQDLGVPFEPNLDQALEWCDVANVLRIQLERQQTRYIPSLREYSLYFGLHKARLERLTHPIVIMHPGPINRGVELQSDVADGPHSIILQQVENGVAVRMAVLYLLADQIRNPQN
jgi:aspartate carbamoyltransferase catalytic subunit